MGEVFGIDVSHHQGAIDWKKVAGAGIKFVIMKCQYESASHRIDERFEANYLGAGQNGIKRGVYIYIARASIADIEGDANALLRHLKGRPLEYGIWLDLEDASVAATGKGFIRDMSYRYAEIFKAAGYYVGIYSNKDWYTRLIHDDLKRDFDFWFARYPRNDVGQYNPTSALRPSSNIAVAWQYSSKGHVDGIKGYVDLDVDYDGIIDLMAAEKPLKGNPYSEPISNIKKGMVGIGVMWVQWQLNVYGYGLAVDGIFGKRTEEAVKDFQQQHFLKADGIVGILTRTMLIDSTK
jgi:GH25 family lysozyme M1 (1,4-beta-N-acetylmuramidase)